MNTISARQLLKYSTEELWNILDGEFILRFDDGEIKTNARETLYSSYAFDLHREYPKTPLLVKHHVQSVLKGSRLSANTHLNILGVAMWSVYDTYRVDPSLGLEEIDLRDILAERVYRLTNVMYNELSLRLEEYVTSLSIDDFLDVVNNPKVKEVHASMVPTQASIDKTYDVINELLAKDPIILNNPISKAVRSKLVNGNQVNQCVGARGFLTDTDSNLFPIPIRSNYTLGITSFYDSLIESRSAAKSLVFSKEPLQQAEYFSRRLQLISQTVRNLHVGDCGTDIYERWRVRPAKFVDGEKVFDGDLGYLAGKNYLDPETGKLKSITRADKHLEGKTIKMRSVLHCMHPDPYGICSTCFGELFKSIPRKTNIGQATSTSITQKSSQNVLSVKHYDGSSKVDTIELSQDEENYLKVSPDKNSYLLNERIKNKTVKIVIPPGGIPNITDIFEVDSVDQLNITRVSEIESIALHISDENFAEVVPISVVLNKRLASITQPFLRFIREKGMDIDDKMNYVFDMTGWDYSQPILTLPLRHFNMSDHSKDIATMLESRIAEMRNRDKSVSPSAFLVELFDLVNSKLNVNLAVLEVVLYSVMIVSAENEDYSLPKPWTQSGLGVMARTMVRRSLGAAMAYEGHKDIIVDPMNYILTRRVSHPFDYILMPQLLNRTKKQE